MIPPKVFLPGLCLALTTFANGQTAGTYLGVAYNSNNAIPTLAINVEGQEYMVYFDGSQGSQAFLGDKQGAGEAVDEINGELNSLSLQLWGQHWQYYGVPQPPWYTAPVANAGDNHDEGSFFYQVTYSEAPGESDYYMGYGADIVWVKDDISSVDGAPARPEATFVAVPETSGALCAAAGILALGLRRKR